jgi:hypothetical protein
MDRPFFSPFCRLLRLAGSQWRYSTPPPHGFSRLGYSCLRLLGLPSSYFHTYTSGYWPQWTLHVNILRYSTVQYSATHVAPWKVLMSSQCQYTTHCLSPTSSPQWFRQTSLPNLFRIASPNSVGSDQVTPRVGVLEKAIFAQKIPDILHPLWIQMFSAEFTTARHCSLSSTVWPSPHPLSLLI